MLAPLCSQPLRRRLRFFISLLLLGFLSLAGEPLAWAQEMVRDSAGGGGTTAIVSKRAKKQGDREAETSDVDTSPASVPRVVVTGDRLNDAPPAYAGGQVAEGGRLGLLGDRSIFDTPFSTTNYTEELIKNQQARTVSDVLLNDPSVNTQWPRGTFTERYQIRGFTVSGDESAFNGLFGLTPSRIALPQSYERVELFKGPNALLNGKVGTVGGSINYVPKRATAEPITRVTATYASDAQFGTEVDVGRRFGKSGELGVRFNGLYAGGEIEGADQTQQLTLLSLGVDYRWKRFRISGDLIYQDTYQTVPRSQVYDGRLDGDPATRPTAALRPPNANGRYQQPYERAGATDYIGTLRAELDATENIYLYAAAGGNRSRTRQVRDIPILDPAFGDPAIGDFPSFPYYARDWAENDAEQIGARLKFNLGPTKNEVALSYNRYHTRGGGNFAELIDFNQFPNGLPDNLYKAPRYPRPDLPYLPRKGPRQYANTDSSVAIADVASILDDRVQAIVGGRLQRVESGGYDTTTGKKTQSYDESKLTPAYTLLVKPIKQLSLYASYIQALEQGPTAPEGTINRGEVFPPNDTEQYEVGAKLDLGRFGVTLAWFQITQPFGQTVAGSGGGLPRFVVDGEQRNRGVELSLFGEPWKGVRLLGGVAYLDPVLQKTQDGLYDGHKAPGNSDFVVNINAEWDLPFVPGLTLSGRVAYQTEQYVDNSNTLEIPDWVRFDLGARYARKIAGKLTTFRATVENVADKNYWASAANGYLLAQPRTFLLSVTVDY